MAAGFMLGNDPTAKYGKTIFLSKSYISAISIYINRYNLLMTHIYMESWCLDQGFWANQPRSLALRSSTLLLHPTKMLWN